jgi:hypothetical protein
VALSEIASIVAISDCENTILQTVIPLGRIIAIRVLSNKAAEDI